LRILEHEMKRHGNKLTAAAVRAASRPGLYGDGHGLYLQVSAFATKAWVFRYMIDGQARKMGLGPLHTVSLAEARKRASDVRLKVLDRIDPIEDAHEARAKRKVEAAKAKTFKWCADTYVEANRTGWKNDKHAAQWVATFNETKRGRTVYPAATEAINALPVSAIDTGLVLAVLEPLWKKTPESASRIRGRIEAVLNWAQVRGYRDGDNPARWRGHLDKTLPQPAKVKAVEHHEAVPYADAPSFMAELRARKSISAFALEFCILTAARTSEVIGARWVEFTEIDASGGAKNIPVWTVPADRMKAGREHRIPLSDRALAVLAELPREGEYLFPGAQKDKPLSNMAMLELLRGMRGKGPTVHGFRSTFRDWAAEQTAYPNEMCEIALAHAIGDKAEAAYRRGDMMEKRRRLMADWAAYCANPPSARDKVVSIRESA
jgi:integrase